MSRSLDIKSSAHGVPIVNKDLRLMSVYHILMPPKWCCIIIGMNGSAKEEITGWWNEDYESPQGFSQNNCE